MTPQEAAGLVKLLDEMLVYMRHGYSSSSAGHFHFVVKKALATIAELEKYR